MNKEKYKKYLLSKHWFCFRKYFYKNNEKKCKKCGTDKNLNLHHYNYRNIGKETLKDVVCLCKNCHTKAHEMRKINRANGRIKGRRGWKNKKCNVGSWD